jgi:hypothetical protein
VDFLINAQVPTVKLVFYMVCIFMVYVVMWLLLLIFRDLTMIREIWLCFIQY